MKNPAFGARIDTNRFSFGRYFAMSPEVIPVIQKHLLALIENILSFYDSDSVPFSIEFPPNVGETPSACAILQTKDNIGYLASAATLPSFRGQGLQRRLLQVRIDAAKQQGCDLVCSQAPFGSTSHHNLQKAGLQLAYTKAIWTR